MTKKIISFLAIIVVAASCSNDKLCYDSHLPKGNVNVRINWAQGLNVPTANGMRVNIFSLCAAPHYGKDDVSCHGCSVDLQQGSTYKTHVYNYIGNNVQFRNESDPALIEATSAPLVRSTYSRAFPNDPTVSEIVGDMHVGTNPSYTVATTSGVQYIDTYPEDVAVTYTFEIRGITGAQFINATRGAISGMSASYFLDTGSLAATPSTVLFDATTNVAQGTITGSLRTFGRLSNEDNYFTIEVLFPSNTNGIMQKTWDVTSQIAGGTNYHIVIDNSGIVVPDEGGQGASNWDVDVNDWNSIDVPLN